MYSTHPMPLTTPVIVLVEGKNFLHLLGCLKESHPWSEQLYFIDYCDLGTSPVRTLEALRVATGFEQVRVVGVMRDCEDSRTAAQDQTVNAFESTGFVAPTREGEITPGEPGTSFMLVPVADTGCIESALRKAASDRAHLDCAEQLLECVGDNKRNSNWRDKVVVRAIIAASSKPEATLGNSVRLNLWDCAHPEIVRIVEWMRSLALAEV